MLLIKTDPRLDKLEAIFKCFARALRYACSKDARLKDQLPSTKGLL